MDQKNETAGQPFSEDTFAQYIFRTLDKAIADRREMDKLIDRWWKDWRDIKDVKLYPYLGCANFSVPVSSTATDAVIPRIVDSVFDIDPPIEPIAINSTSTKFRDLVKGFLKWDLKTHPDLMKQIWFFVQNTVWGGTGYIKSFFHQEKEVIEEEHEIYSGPQGMIQDPQTGKPLEVNPENDAQLATEGIQVEIKTVIAKEKKWKKYNPDMVAVDIKDVYFPSDSTSIEDAWDNSLIATTVWRTKDFLHRQLKQDKKELYKNLTKIKIKGFDTDESEPTEDERKRQELAQFAVKTKKLKCYEVYVNYDVDGDGLEEKIVALVHLKSKTLFGWEKFPYDHNRCPLTAGYIKPIHNQVYGVGIPEMLFDTKGELDATHNQRTDRGSFTNNPILTHTPESGYNSSIHKTGPGRHWRLKNRGPEAIGYLEPPKYERNSHEEEERLLGYAQKRSNVTDYTLGSESSVAGNKTAAGMQMLLSEAGVGFRHFTKWMCLSLGEIFNQRWALYQQYWGKAADEEIQEWVQEIMDTPDNPLGQQGVEALQQQFNLVMTASKEDKKLELAKMQAIYEVATTSPLFEQMPEKLREVTVRLFRRIGEPDAETLVPTNEEIQQYQVGIQKQAMEQMKAEQDEQAKKEYETALSESEKLNKQEADLIRKQEAGNEVS